VHVVVSTLRGRGSLGTVQRLLPSLNTALRLSLEQEALKAAGVDLSEAAVTAGTLGGLSGAPEGGSAATGVPERPPDDAIIAQENAIR
jgi:hypothetical protein